jgi:ABC-type transport system substrate-binding protein
MFLLVMSLILTACGGGGQTDAQVASADSAREQGTQTKQEAAVQLSSQSTVNELIPAKYTATAEEAEALTKSHTNAAGKTFVNVATKSNCSSFEPYKGIKNTTIFGKPIYEGLFSREGVAGEYVPIIADDFTKTDDYTWRVKIKDYVYDSQGNHITASDVVFSYMKIGKEVYLNGYFRQLEKIDIIDDYTVDIHMSSPSQALFDKMSYNYIWSEKAFNDTGDSMAANPVGTGPYVVSDWVSGTNVTFEKRPDYWEKDLEKIHRNSLSNVDIINFKVIKDEAQMVIALQTGEVDLCEDLSVKNVNFFADDTSYNVFQEIDNRVHLINFNCNPDYSQCGDLKLRQAICYAIDRESIIIGAFDGEGIEAKGPHTQTLTDFNPDWLNREYYAYNVDKASECLSESKYDGSALRILIESDTDFNKEAQIIQNCLLAVGIKTDILQVDAALFTAYRYDPAQFDIQIQSSGSSDYAINSWVQNCDTSDVGTSNMGVKDLILYDILMKAVDKAPDNKQEVEAFYDYITDNAMYIGLANRIKSVVATKVLTGYVSDYAQYASANCSAYVWDK